MKSKKMRFFQWGLIRKKMEVQWSPKPSVQVPTWGLDLNLRQEVCIAKHPDMYSSVHHWPILVSVPVSSVRLSDKCPNYVKSLPGDKFLSVWHQVSVLSLFQHEVPEEIPILGSPLFQQPGSRGEVAWGSMVSLYDSFIGARALCRETRSDNWC